MKAGTKRAPRTRTPSRPPPLEPVTQPGDVWELGDHRLICGDATNPEHVQRLMGGRTASMIFTDPPYGVSYVSQSGKFDAIKNDEKTADDLVNTLLLPAFRNMVQHVQDNAAFYVWHASSTREDFAYAMKAAGLMEKQYLIWAKNSFVMGHADYHWAHEPCFYSAKAGSNPAYFGDRTQQTVWTAVLANRKDGTGQREVVIANGLVLMDGKGGKIFIQARAPKGKKIRHLRVEEGTRVVIQPDNAQGDLWSVGRDAQTNHPTQKPVDLAIRAIRNSTIEGQIVLDLFLGSGCTLIGAEKTGRRCYGLELDPKYCDVIVNRWQALTGKIAQRVNLS